MKYSKLYKQYYPVETTSAAFHLLHDNKEDIFSFLQTQMHKINTNILVFRIKMERYGLKEEYINPKIDKMREELTLILQLMSKIENEEDISIEEANEILVRMKQASIESIFSILVTILGIVAVSLVLYIGIIKPF